MGVHPKLLSSSQCVKALTTPRGARIGKTPKGRSGLLNLVKVTSSNAFTRSSLQSEAQEKTTSAQTSTLERGALDEPALVLGNVVPWRPTPKLSRVDAPVDTPPLVVLPGFGNCSKDYECPNGNPDDSMVAVLRRRGFRVYVAQVERRDWLNVGRAILSRKYWVGLCTVDPGYRWYLERIQQAVDKARLECGSDQVHLVGHSAGGWLGRAFVADPLYFDSPTWDEGIPHQGISSLVTLGTPHVPPLATSGRDMTGGALTWVNLQWPGAHFADKGVGYMCVAGCAVQADRHAPRNSIERYAHSSYSQGANNLVLEGVFHSMGTHKGWPIEHRWYGSNDVVDHWAHCLVTQ